MKRIGTKAINMITGALRPTSWDTGPRVAARLYPGAVEATPITMLDRRPIAPTLRPLLATPGGGGAVVVISAILWAIGGDAESRRWIEGGQPGSRIRAAFIAG